MLLTDLQSPRLQCDSLTQSDPVYAAKSNCVLIFRGHYHVVIEYSIKLAFHNVDTPWSIQFYKLQLHAPKQHISVI